MASHVSDTTELRLGCEYSDPDNPSIDHDIGDHARGHDAEDEVGSDDVLRRRGQMLVGQMGEGLGVPVGLGLGQEPE